MYRLQQVRSWVRTVCWMFTLWLGLGSLAQAQSVATQTRWFQQRGKIVRTGVNFTSAADRRIFNYAPRPDWNANAWRYTPDPVYVNYNVNSRLCNSTYKCNRDLDFMFFSTEIRIPAGVTVNSLVIKVGAIDDAVQVKIYNSAYPVGFAPSNGYLYLGGSKQTGNLASHFRKNEVNTVLLVVADACCKHLTTGKVEVLLNGKQINLKNSLPVVTGLPPTCAEAGKVYSSIPVAAYDPDNDPLEFTLLQEPLGATVNKRTGYISWTPTNNLIGRSFVFEMHICDDLQGIVLKKWTVTVKKSCSSNSNNPPRITTSPSTSGTEDTTYTYNPKATDPDTGDVLTWKLLKGPNGPTLQFNTTTGALSWKPGDNDVSKSHDFEIQVCDKANACVKQAWKVFVRNINDKPVIVGTPPVSASVNVLVTYSPRVIDPDPNESHTWRLVKGPTGSRIDSRTGRWTWTPSNNQSSKTYAVEIQVCDRAGACVRQSWQITVKRGNRPPKITSTPPATGTEQVQYVYNPVASDPDPGDTLTWKLINAPNGARIDSSTGRVTWTSQEADSGRTFTFEIQVCDNSNACHRQTWTVYVRPVNDKPRIISTPSTIATENRLYAYSARAFDPDRGDVLTWKLLKGPAGTRIGSSTGALTWTPGDAAANKWFDFQIQVCDKANACATQSWRVYVRNVNDAPRIVGTPPTTARVGVRVTYSPRVIDPDPGERHTWRVTRGPSGATISSSTGQWTWTPARSQANRTFDVQIEVCDRARACVRQSWKITVGKAPNTAPRITSTPGTTATEDQRYTYAAKVTDPDPGDAWVWRLLKGPAGTRISSTGVVTWTPGDSHVLKNHDFEIQVCDKAGACAKQPWRVYVRNVNDAPKIVGTPPRVATARKTVNYKPKVVDPDPNESHTWKLNRGPTGAKVNPSTGEWTWTPGNADVGKSFDVEIQVCDKAGACAKQAWKISVQRAPNSPPKITSTPGTLALEDKPYTYNAKASDPDGDKLTWRVLQGPNGLKIDPSSGKVTWTATNADVGKTFTVVIEVCDTLGACDTQKWSVGVQNTNDPPKIVGTPPTTVAETRTLSYNPKVTDPDVGDIHTWKLLKGPSGATIDPKSGALTWTPAKGQGGKSYDFEIQVCDQILACDKQAWKVKVTISNTPPKITGSPLLVGTPEVPYTAQFGVNDPDTGDAHTWKLLRGPQGASTDQKGKVTWTPKTSDANRSFDFEIQVCDKAGACDKRAWQVKVGNANRPPVITSKPTDNATVGQPWTYAPAATDPDPGDTLTWKLKKGPAGTNLDPVSGKVTWTPAAADSDKPASFTIEVCDNGKPSKCGQQSFQITPRTGCKVDVNCKSDWICVQQPSRRVCLPPGCSTKSPKCAGQNFCKDGKCGQNPCDNKNCVAGSTCRPTDGKCVKSCAGIKCPAGQRCDGGSCIKDPCNGQCKEICDTSTPARPYCAPNPCGQGSCKHGRVCDYGRCIDNPCGSMTCPNAGETCVAGQCVPRKPCHVDVDCPTDEVCLSKRCHKPGCYTAPCARSQQCLGAKCKDDLCRKNGGPNCSQTQFCRPHDGKCIDTCSNVSCPAGQKCVDGACKGDPCNNVSCKNGTVCVAGKCETDHCQGSKRCKHGRICSKDKNECTDDPCAGVTCPDSNEVCVNGQCQAPPACRFDKECSKGLICVKGKCVIPTCTKDSECKGDDLCVDGKCVTDPCLNTTCKNGTFCRNGKCVDTCAGVYCKPTEQCVDGKCIGDPCAGVTCQSDETCNNGKCDKDPCAKDSCRYGRICDGKQCVRDPCDDVQCPKGQVCNDGQCSGDRACNVDVDCPGDGVCVAGKCKASGCYNATCKQDSLCTDASCKDNPCANKKCAAGETCRPADGKCIADCPSCPSGEVCVDGQCQADPCDGITCQDGERCDAGTCVKDPCAKQGAALCRYQRVCNSNSCKDDPCAGMQCANGYQCRAGQCIRKSDTDGGADGEPTGDGEPVGDGGDGDVTDGEPGDGDGGATDAEPTDGEPTVVDETSKPENSRDVVRGTRGGYGDQPTGVAPPVGCTCAAVNSSTRWSLLWLLLLLVPFLRRRRK